MIDIHAHILPYVDDGADDMADALLMAELAVESGVRAVIATPHSNIPGEFKTYEGTELQRRVSDLQERIARRGLPLTLLCGMEIYGTEDTAGKIQSGKLISLNGSGYYLVEFGFHKDGEWITAILESIRDLGVVPVVAHPERYVCIQRDPGLALDWIDMGCQLQMNRGSIFGKFGRASFYAADELLKNDWITYVASDAHSPYQRTTYMRDIYEFLKEEFSRSRARRLLTENAEQYLLGERKQVFPPEGKDEEYGRRGEVR